MNSPPPRVVVLGAGVAGLETAFLLEHRLSGRADVHVVYDDDTFLFRPNLVYVAFGADPSASTLHVSDTLARKRIPGNYGPVEGVDADAGRVHDGPGRQLPYEHGRRSATSRRTCSRNSPRASPSRPGRAGGSWTSACTR